MTTLSPLSMVAAAPQASLPVPVARLAMLRSRHGLFLLLFAMALLLSSPARAVAQTNLGAVNTGTTSTAQSVTVTATTAGQVSAVNVLTLGQSGLDYAAASTGTCASAHLLVGNTCTVSVTFAPTAPGVRPGAVVLADSSGNTLGVAYLTGTGLGGLGVFLPGTMQTIAGQFNNYIPVLDGGSATNAGLYLPESIALDGAGNLYIADSNHNRIREVNATTNTISTIVGTGSASYTGDGGLATQATLNIPAGVAVDGAGNLYIADSGNSVIRKVTLSTGIITTVAGNGTPGSAGDNGQATAANLDNPQGITVDAAGNLYIADTYNEKIRKVSTSGIITTVAGNGTRQSSGVGTYSGDNGPATAAGLNSPYAVAFDSAGNMYIPDSGNNRIREVNAGTQIITTYAGVGTVGFSGDGGPAVKAQLDAPSGIAFDPAGNLYIADTQNAVIRKVSATNANIATFAGNGTGKYGGDGHSALQAGLYAPYGLAFSPTGNLLIADYLDNVIRSVQANLATFTLPASAPVRQASKSPTQDQTLENDGTAALNLTAITPDSNSALDPNVTTCATTTPLGANTDCVYGAQFAPTVAANSLTATITTQASSDNSPLLIQITGVATAVNSTTTVLQATPNPADFGQTVVLQATVTTGTGTLTGTVTFSDGATVLASNVPLNTSGVASYTTTALAVGLHSLTAAYVPDPAHFKSTSSVVSLPVNEPTNTTLSSSQLNASVGAAVTFTATVSPSNGGGVVPDGTVNFLDGATVIGSGTLTANGNGSATTTFTTSTLANGTHTITAVYGGDAAKYVLSSNSNAVTQNIDAPTTTAVIATPNPSSYGTAVTFTATVMPSGTVTPTGTVQFLDGNQQIGSAQLSGSPTTASFTTSTLAAGQHTITASYSGGAGSGASTGSTVLNVAAVQTATVVNASPNPGIGGRGTALTATVKVLQGNTIPTGNVSFADGATPLGTAVLNGSGTAALTANLAVGTHSITATYAPGTANDGPSASAALPLTVNLATTQMALTVAPNPALVLSPVVFTMKVTGNGGIPGGPVTLTVDGRTATTATLDASGTATVTLATLGVGTHAVTATYGGDSNDAGSTSAATSEVIQPIPTATALGTTTAGTNSQQSILVATVVGNSGPTPTGTVQFLNGSSVIGSSALDATGVASLVPNLPTGTYAIVAQYSGDALHSPSTSQPTSLSTAPATFSLSTNPPSLTLTTGQNGTITVNLASVNKAADTVTLGCANLPAAVNCHFASSSLVLAAGGQVSTQLTIDTNNPLSGGTTVAAVSGSSPTAPLAAGWWLPLAGLFGWMLLRFRRRAQKWMVVLLVCVAGAASLALSGCGGFSQKTATPGTYTIEVTGVGTQSNQTHYVNFTLTINK